MGSPRGCFSVAATGFIPVERMMGLSNELCASTPFRPAPRYCAGRDGMEELNRSVGTNLSLHRHKAGGGASGLFMKNAKQVPPDLQGV